MNDKKPLRTLIIEDREDDALLLLNELERGSYRPEHRRVEDPDSLNDALHEDWDIIFCDYSMPAMNGLEALSIVRHRDPDVPFVFVSGTIGEDVAVEAMRTGAQDYIMKDNLKRLLPAVQRELKEAQGRRERREAEERLHYLIRHDSLTGLPNRVYFIELLERAVASAEAGGNTLAVAHIDLDRFKTINDSLGYEAGNQLLRETARRLTEKVAGEGEVTHLAADEFALLLNSPGSRREVESLLHEVIASLESAYQIYGWSLYLGASIGVSFYPENGASAAELLRNADITTYRAKDEGGSTVLFFSQEMAVQLEERLAMERSMRLALERQEFFLHYQPQVELASGRTTGVEALVRWRQPGGRTVRPDQFIPLAEETGFILPLGDWILRQACAQVQRWKAAGIPDLRVAVNVSPRQFHQADMVELIVQVLDEYGLEPECLAIEITETSFIRDTGDAIRVVDKLRQLGVEVALDDFGTGYSSLSYLRYFKMDVLKIDRSFICDIPGDRNGRAIVSAIIAMADKLEFHTIAEGVETRDQYNFLRDQGCGSVQGYFLGRPDTAGNIEARLRQEAKRGKP